MMQALIFDFDGLILDTEVPDYQCWQELYAEHGTSLPLETWASNIGLAAGHFDPHTHLENTVGRSIDRARMTAKRRARFLELLAEQAILPGVESYISEGKQRGLKIGLASSSDSDWVVGHLTRLGLVEQFDCIRCADHVSKAKPDPELYLAVLKAFGLPASQAIAFEDSPNGITAAKRAGLFCVTVPNPMTSQLSLSHADLRLTSMAEMSLADLLTMAHKSKVES